MKRICLYGASENLGGTEVYLITMVRALKDEITFDFLVHHEYGKIPFEDEIVSYGGKVYREYYKNGERNLPEYISPEKLLSMHPEWDGICLNLQSIDTSYRLLVEAKKKKMKHRIIHSHSCNYFDTVGLKTKIFEFYYKITKNNVVTECLCCSSKAGEWMFGNSMEYKIIPNAVQFEKFSLDDQTRYKMRSEFQINDDEVVIGFCGRLDEIKRPEFMMDIFYHLKKKLKCKLIYVGDGVLRKQLQLKAQQLQITDSVIFTGVVENIKEYYQMMDCFVLPSRFEGFGIVLLEAQAAGLRCYTTDKVVPYETNVSGRVNFISQNATAKEWAEKIIKNGFDRVNCLDILENSDYSVKVMKQRLLEILKNE